MAGRTCVVSCNNSIQQFHGPGVMEDTPSNPLPAGGTYRSSRASRSVICGESAIHQSQDSRANEATCSESCSASAATVRSPTASVEVVSRRASKARRTLTSSKASRPPTAARPARCPYTTPIAASSSTTATATAISSGQSIACVFRGRRKATNLLASVVLSMDKLPPFAIPPPFPALLP